MTDRTCTQEQRTFKECVSENVEHGWEPCPNTEAKHHVAELRDRGIRQHLLDVVLNERKCSRNDDGDATDNRDEVDRRVKDVEPNEEHWVETRNQKDTGNDHG